MNVGVSFHQLIQELLALLSSIEHVCRRWVNICNLQEFLSSLHLVKLDEKVNVDSLVLIFGFEDKEQVNDTWGKSVDEEPFVEVGWEYEAPL